MSGAFSERERAFEEKWAHDEELRFRVLARRNKLLGLWAAGEMGLAGAEAESYSQAIVMAEVAKEGDEAVFGKIKGDFGARRIVRTDHLIRTRMDEFLATAKKDVMG